MEGILDGVNIAPGVAAATDHLSQISWCYKVPCQQVEANSSTESLQAMKLGEDGQQLASGMHILMAMHKMAMLLQCMLTGLKDHSTSA